MCKARFDIATTNLLGDTDNENGLLGRLIVAVDHVASGNP